MKKLLTDWGFTRQGWSNNSRGEYLVFLQLVLLAAFTILPVYQLPGFKSQSTQLIYLTWFLASILSLIGLTFIIKGLIDLGKNLTPLPYPREDGELVQTGIYGIVRHPLYSGGIFAALGWTIFQFSLSHLIATAILLIFFDIKSRREETWLSDKYPDYSEYRQRVKKLIPGIY
ncbi:isoprenylcysteine carboxylmethyltransferase family protein [Microcoleus sp. PH2017_08_TRC_O_A]|uniref:methyltransferase family protein n=1 Tax=Microcoleus sp. PH2017_08_TRC_O_A TaxID=2798819 RepID=UPI001E12174F|nr:isoprenylcysteine carboxylmethyltransferase family protein [Microcoleus sp. PH2017_08_TRC_O_A]MCC3430295.1 isoprenylcysteine carboxylmethyltransferase family protein [Microcoleus sp. PH2017_04_SCI_O_A]MCC3454146.1 isoprenylcysteine carboxylmethyltransferase family protein [Microcoleus sp. PH2017_08_TRC_O_A]TAE57341.1 MAG: isoprenylcysteine carboxylmethyltransferase family protein [Oscillatoriales cyanobacterium]TAE71891.1 MAG: isoprenylcysteine carboxylmethyltransferase family protein [Oscil